MQGAPHACECRERPRQVKWVFTSKHRRCEMLEVGCVLDGTYAVCGRLGAGSMGEVFDARDVRRNRGAALKVSWPDQPRGALRREAEVMGSFSHPSLVSLYSF